MAFVRSKTVQVVIASVCRVRFWMNRVYKPLRRSAQF
jgi:hypothetical protein